MRKILLITITILSMTLVAYAQSAKVSEEVISFNSELIASKAFADHSAVVVLLSPTKYRDKKRLEIQYLWPSGKKTTAHSSLILSSALGKDFEAHILSDHVQVFGIVPVPAQDTTVVYRYTWGFPVVKQGYLPLVTDKYLP